LSCPELLPNNYLKVQNNNLKPKRITSAESAADSELQPKVTTSSHTCSNTHVVGSAVYVEIHNVKIFALQRL